MTLQQIYESLRQHDSQISFTEATILANNLLKSFVNRTRIIETFDTSITTTASTDGYAIPTDMFMVSSVRVDGEETYRMVGRYTIGDTAGNHQKYFWQVEDGNIRITYDDGNFSYPDAGKAVVVVGFSYATELSAIGDEPEIPEQYHEALIDGLLATLYMRPHMKDINTSMVYKQNYERLVSDAKRYARSRKHTLGAPAPVYY